MKKYVLLATRWGMALLAFAFSIVFFMLFVALLAYRLPAFGERQFVEGDTEPRKVDMSTRSLFETAFGRGMVPLDEHTELYLPKEGNPWIGRNTQVYRVTASARPLMFGGYADAKLIRVTKVEQGQDRLVRPASGK